MIELNYINNSIYIFKLQDYVNLRDKYRITGEIIGNTNFVSALPIKILPEEANLLIELGIAKLIATVYQYTDEKKKTYDQFKSKLFREQQILFKRNRRHQLEAIIDKIVAAKRKKGDNRPCGVILNDEIEKSSKINKGNMIWPILLISLQENEDCREVTKDVIFKDTTQLKCKVFKDLWEKGYYITQGSKFGGDFLVYKGDPLIFHAIFIVRCIEDKNLYMKSAEIVALGRLSTSVKKRAVLAYIYNETIKYITLNWENT